MPDRDAKLANGLFARGQTARLAGDGIVAHALHPGVADGNFASHADAAMQAPMRTPTAQSPDAAAAPSAWLATGAAPGRSTGGYRHGRRLTPPDPAALDDATVDRPWAQGARLIARRPRCRGHPRDDIAPSGTPAACARLPAVGA